MTTFTVKPFTFLALLALLAACSGGAGGGPSLTPPSNNGGGGSTSTPSPAPTPTQSPSPAPTTNTNISSPPISMSAATVHAVPGTQNGSTAWYNGGVTAWASNAGATSAGANGNNTIDTISCTQMGEPSQATELHVHAFIGIYANGTEEAIPSALGMKQPTQPSPDTAPVPSATCFYHLHTHDYSGLIHIEDSSLAQNLNSAPSYARLQSLFDLWGEPITAASVATFNGPVAIYIGHPTGTVVNGNEVVTSYAPFNGDLRTIALGHHIAVWIVVGTPPAAGLPRVEFDVET